MLVIPVDDYPLKKTYDSPEAAIAGALNHPLQRKARADTAKLIGTTVLDAYWTDTEFMIRFSNELLLHIYVDGEEVRWDVTATPPRVNDSQVERVGAPAIICRWKPEVGDHITDRSALTAKRRGSEFQKLFVNEMGFLVYCRGHLIWWFHAVRRTDLDQPMLFVTEAE